MLVPCDLVRLHVIIRRRTSRRSAQAQLSPGLESLPRYCAALQHGAASEVFGSHLSIGDLAPRAAVWDDNCNSLNFQTPKFKSSWSGWETMEILTLMPCWRLRTKKRYVSILGNVLRIVNCFAPQLSNDNVMSSITNVNRFLLSIKKEAC